MFDVLPKVDVLTLSVLNCFVHHFLNRAVETLRFIRADKTVFQKILEVSVDPVI
jgi:hypothetical protein